MTARIDWKKRALDAEAALQMMAAAGVEQLDALKKTYDATCATYEQAIERMNDRAALMGLNIHGRTIRFTFVRNAEFTAIECMSTYDADVDGWRKALLLPKDKPDDGG